MFETVEVLDEEFHFTERERFEDNYEDVEYLDDGESFSEMPNPTISAASKKINRQLSDTQKKTSTTSYLDQAFSDLCPAEFAILPTAAPKKLNRPLSATPQKTSSKTPVLFTPRPPGFKFRTITSPAVPESEKENYDEQQTELLKGCLNMLENKQPMDDIDHFCSSLSGQIRRCNMSQVNKARVFQNLQNTLALFIINEISED